MYRFAILLCIYFYLGDCQQPARNVYDGRNKGLTEMPNNFTADTEDILLSGNDITSVPTSTWNNVTSVQHLDLYNNQVTTFPDLRPIGNTVREVYLGHNGMTYVNPVYLEGLTALQLLSLTTNMLTSFPDLSAVGATLWHLDLRSNGMTTVDIDVLTELDAMENLNLYNNRISSFPNLTSLEHAMRRLTHLHLSNNDLGPRLPDVTPAKGTLKYLYLAANKISEIDIFIYSST